MKAVLCSLLIFSGGLGCARVYRPLILERPPVVIHADGLSGEAALQPWGDNSRYEFWARESNLRIFTVTLENHTTSELDVLRLELPEGSHLLSPEEAIRTIKQQPLKYFLLPLTPFLPSVATSGGGAIGPVVLGVAALVFGAPNAAVAFRSNQRLETFFRDNAWQKGILKPGQQQRGVLIIQSRETTQPLTLWISYRGAVGDRRLELTGPGHPPQSKPQVVRQG
ncbi:MAG: hypothetical protein WAS25_14960 [Geothrix sp.]|uniref:hypothetical protein n=1 Tax=Geothrix sp. TaxID=1962974 RepID=UPI003BB10D0B